MDIIISHLNLNLINMELIEMLQNNLFLKQLYPKGIKDFFLSKIELNYFNKATIILNCKNKPEIEVKKWGVWEKNFNGISIEFSIQFIKRMSIINWENNIGLNCNCVVKKEDFIDVKFYGNDWEISFLTNNGMLFQSANPYLAEND